MKNKVIFGVVASAVMYLGISMSEGGDDAAAGKKEESVAESMQQAKAKAQAVEANLAAAEATRRSQFEDF